jgi:hypothetical protein
VTFGIGWNRCYEIGRINRQVTDPVADFEVLAFQAGHEFLSDLGEAVHASLAFAAS